MTEMENQTISYKNLHEKFVSGHNGTTLTEISLQLAVSVASVLFRDGLCLCFALNNIDLNFWLKLCLDYILTVIPLLLVATVLSSSISLVFTSILTVAIVTIMGLCFLNSDKSKSKLKFSVTTMLNIKMTGRRPFIDYFRSYVNIGTALVILAVDFVIFPRRFAKTETYGSGFMDVGVGCFVMANAVVSSEARGKQKQARGIVHKCIVVLTVIKSCLPLVILGVIRVLSVKGLDYHEHVSEYGVHWNFFLTLAVVKVVSTVILTVFPVQMSGILSIMIAVLYQYCLSGRGWSHYILYGHDGTGSRMGVIDSNREGIYSCIGYISIYLAGVELGRFIFMKREKLYDWCKVLLYIILVCIVSGVLLYLFTSYIEPISRRMCNASYIFWMIGLNHMLLAGYLLGDLLISIASFYNKGSIKEFKSRSKEQPLCLLAAVNYNALGYFLLSNLMTGLVNMSVRTIQTPPTESFIILSFYLFLLSFVTLFLYKYKISTKFW